MKFKNIFQFLLNNFFLLFGFIILLGLGFSTIAILKKMSTNLSEYDLMQNQLEYSTQLKYLDEVISGSARNFVYTNDSSWLALFNKATSLHNFISKEHDKLALSAKHKRLFKVNDSVSHILFNIEGSAIKFIDSGNIENALELFNSKEYIQHKNNYYNNVEQLQLDYAAGMDEIHSEFANIIFQSRKAVIVVFIFSFIALIIFGYISIKRTRLIKAFKRLTNELRNSYEKLKLSEEKYRISNSKYQRFINESLEGIVLYEFNKPLNTDLTREEQIEHCINNMYIAECNNIYAQMYGFESAKQVTNKNLSEIWGENEFWKEVVKQYIDEKYRWINYESHFVVSENDTRYYNTNLVSIRNDNNEIVEIWATQIDNTEKKLNETKLKESEQHFRLLSDLTFEGIIIHQAGVCIDVNSSLCAMTGYSIDELIGKNVVELCIPKQYHEVVASKISQDKAEPYEIAVRRKDGSDFSALFEGRYFDKKNNIRVGSVRDITDKKEADKRIMNAIIEAEEKERDHFAREIHDGLGPILSSLNMYFDWLSKTDDNKKKEMIVQNGSKNIQEAISIVEEISNNLTPRTLNAFGLSAAVRNFIGRLEMRQEPKIKFNSTFEQRFNINLEAAIYRIITELINNSLKHAEASLIEIFLKFNTHLKTITVEYSDNGIGFNLYETLKMNKGFGLVNIKQRISAFDGLVNFDTSPKKGLKVKIQFRNIDTLKNVNANNII
jgi:PAS domain S-box-containing protein